MLSFGHFKIQSHCRLQAGRDEPKKMRQDLKERSDRILRIVQNYSRNQYANIVDYLEALAYT